MHPIPQDWCEPQQSGQGQQEQAAQVTSPWVLNTSEDADTTDAPANLFQHFTLFFCLKEMPLVSVHAQCTLTCHWAQLQELILPPNILSLFPYDRLKKKKSNGSSSFPSIHYTTDYTTWSDLTIQRVTNSAVTFYWIHTFELLRLLSQQKSCFQLRDWEILPKKKKKSKGKNCIVTPQNGMVVFYLYLAISKGHDSMILWCLS